MGHDSIQDSLRALPAVGLVVTELQRRGGAASARDPELIAHLTRSTLDELRGRARQGSTIDAGIDAVIAAVVTALEDWNCPSTRPVVNATGVILHSGLGRAALPQVSVDALTQAAGGYCLLEVNRAQGERRKRDAHLERHLCHLTGAEAATVVNNNAAATMIILNTLARDREVVVSRSQMVEIGGSFRLPDVFEASGCILREVGTTNRSYPRDYEDAINENTGALMLVHTSNYRIVGFTQHVNIDEMVAIGKQRDLPVIDDLGSGSLLPPEVLGIGDEPPVARSVRAGADLICFSGDKMIGGSQAGIIVGKKVWIDRIRKNPLARAFRIDKMQCLALEAALKLYYEPSLLLERVPTLRMITESADAVRPRTDDLAAALSERLGDRATIEVVSDESETGAGSLPTISIPTWCVAMSVPGRSCDDVARRLRTRRHPIFTRVREDRILFDCRTVLPGENDVIVSAVDDVLGNER